MSTKTLLPISEFRGWLAMGERGLSSEAIVEHLTGVPMRRCAGDPVSECERCEGTGDLYGRVTGPIAICPDCTGTGVKPLSPGAWRHTCMAAGDEATCPGCGEAQVQS